MGGVARNRRCFFVVDRYYASAVSREQSNYREGTKAMWQRHAANYNKWVDALLPATALVEDPESPEPPKSSHFSGAGGAEADGAEGKAAPPAASRASPRSTSAPPPCWTCRQRRRRACLCTPASASASAG